MVKKVLLKRTVTGHRLSVNTDGIADVNRDHPPFIRFDRNVSLTAAGFFTKLTVSSINYAGTQLFDQGYVDADYELIDPLPSGATVYLMEAFALNSSLTNRPSMSGVNMKLTWTGGAAISSITFGGDASNNTSVNLAGKSATFTYKATGTAPQGGNCTNNSWIMFNFTGTAGPPRNIRLFEAAYEARLLAGEIFDPVWLAGMADYDILRLMDFTHTNNSGVVDYTDIAADTFLSFVRGGQALTSGAKAGPSMATIAALANQTLRPIWINIPHQMTDAAITSYATYLRDNVSTSVPIYVEYSNEVWNTVFTQTTYAQAQGALIAAWNGQSATTLGARWAGLRAAQVSSIFRSVFATNSGNRWVGVLATQLASGGIMTGKLVGLDYFLNPVNSLLRAGDTSATLFSHAAGAPYFGPVPTTTASGSGATLQPYVDAGDQQALNTFLYSQIKADAPSSSPFLNIAFWRTQWQSLISVAAARGWTMVMYEGGNGSQALNPLRDNLSGQTDATAFNLAFAQFASSAEAGTLHNEMYRLYLADGGFKPNKYNALQSHDKFGPWGAQENLADNNACFQAIAAFNDS